MARRRRILAFFAALCVAWTSLWPLVSVAGAILSDSSTPLCHQAGQAVGMTEMPMQDGAPQGGAKIHCPLCVMAFYAGFNPPLTAPPASWSTCSVSRDAHCAPGPCGVEVPLPESRAPPSCPRL
jgi:hypothetical protein